MKYVILCMALFTSLSFADSHTSAEQTVLANIDAYWVARNTKDWETVVALSSAEGMYNTCLLYTSPSPRDRTRSRMPSSA